MTGDAPYRRSYSGRALHFLKRPIVCALIIGLLIRLLLTPFSGNEDLGYWAGTVLSIEGNSGLYGLSVYYYSPVWGYLLSALVPIANLFGISIGEIHYELVSDTLLSSFPYITVTTIGFNVLVKTVLILFDVLTGVVLYKFIRSRCGEKDAMTAFMIWFFCPLVIFMSSVQVMFDVVSVLFTLLAFIFVVRGNYFLAGLCFSTGCLTKAFPVVAAPIFVAFILAKHRGNRKETAAGIGKGCLGAVLATVAILLPNITAGNLGDAFFFMSSRLDRTIGASEPSTLFDFSVYLMPAVFVIAVLLAVKLYLSDKEDLDRKMLKYIMLGFALLFLIPPWPQYLILLVPFMAYYAIAYDRRYLYLLVLLSAVSTGYAFCNVNFGILYSIVEYTDYISLADFINNYKIPTVELFRSMSGILVWIQAAIIWVIVLVPAIDRICLWRRERCKRIST
ncbi:MAG: hypothetical protein LBV63_02395 [Candidatus Methanoplasma sp.]|jgi:hypothetical protein|nr:hypothetical protein [Candidatus Methanoplasma sp.]